MEISKAGQIVRLRDDHSKKFIVIAVHNLEPVTATIGQLGANLSVPPTKEVEVSALEVVPECYVKFMDAKNGFKESTKDFYSYAEAWEWMLKTFDRPDRDFIHFY